MPRPLPARERKLQLNPSVWGLADARHAAAQILGNDELLKPLLRAIFGRDPVLRHHAADIARRITEKQPDLLAPYTERLLGLFSEISPKEAGDNWRTRAHLGLVIARVAQSRSHRLRAAGLLIPLYYDPSNVVRCTAVEGLGLLARREPGLRPQVQPMIEEALATGTIAMQCRARDALRRWLPEFSRTRL
jgi:HEAT repeat protein